MADDIPEPAERVSVAHIDIVAVTRGFIVGIGGALAGLTAILYACGYLVTRAHLSLLGLYGLIEFNHDFILQEGAKFFIVTAYSVGRDMVLPVLTFLTIAAGLLILLGLSLRARVRRWWDALQRRIPGQAARRVIRVIAFVAAFGLFLWHSDEYLDQFEHPLCFANLLYVDDGIAKCAAAAMADSMGLRRALLQSDQNTDPLFKLIRQGACVLMEIIRGQAAVATNNACVEFRNDRLDTAGVAHSVINIHAAEREVRVTVIEGQVQMLRPGDAMVGANQEYVSTEGGRWQVRQITPAEAAGTGVWTRDYFRAAARQNQSNYLIPAIIAIGLGTYFNNKDGHSSQPSSTQYPPAGPNSPRSQ